jgi:superfamily II DNA or RNA helicase
MDKSLKIKEIHAGSFRCENKVTGTFVKNILSYKEKRKYFDKSIGKEIVKDVTFDYGVSRYGLYYFPSGLVGYVKRKGLLLRRQTVEIIRSPDSYELPRKLIPSLPGIEFESYQAKVFRKVGPNKMGIIVGPTGMGKSIILGGIIDKLYCPNTLLIVPTKSIGKQMYDSFKNWFGDRVGMIGDGIYDQRDITICLFQSLDKFTVSRNNIQLILCDEVHLVNETIKKFLNKNGKNIYYRYGVTATPQKFKHNLKKTFKMMGCFGNILSEVTDKEAYKRVLPVKVNMVSYYCHNPQGTNYQSVMREDILYSKIRNNKLLKAAKSLAISKGMTVLYLVDETKQALIVEKLAYQLNLNPYVVHGKMDNKEINYIKENLNNRKINLCIATRVFSVGTDIPNVDCIVLGSVRKSEIDTLQKIGRGRRRTKHEHLLLIDCVDKVRDKKFNKYFYGYSMQRMQIYREKEWEIRKVIL